MNQAPCFAPRIEIFNPFKKPFAERGEGTTVVARSVVQYLKDRKSKIVAKCTPCQCCACR
jgi:hypothetical protein